MDDYSKFDAIDLANLIQNKDLTASEVIEAAIKRAEAVNPDVNAIVTPMFETALEEAKICDELSSDAPLAGVPFLIKDLTMVKGVRCTMGSRLYENFVPDHDCLLYTSPSPRD